jgi:hypothetical protein
VHVIGHDDVGVELVAMESLLPIAQGCRHHPRQFRAVEVQRSAGAPVQQAIHGRKCPAGLSQAIGKEHAMRGKAAVQTKRDKQRLIDSVPVRKSPLVVSHPEGGAWMQENFSETHAASRLKGGCGHDWPPHIL